MATEAYYGERFEGVLITSISVVIVLLMAGAWSLMSEKMHGCRAAEYTYCDKVEVESTHH